MTNIEIRNCEDALRVLAAFLDHELDDATGEQLERHLETCRSCWSRSEFEKRLKSSLAELASEPVPAALNDHVQGLMRRFTVTGGE